MAYTILSEAYGRRLPKITAEADSADDLTTLGTDYAEGSTCDVDGTTYTLDKVKGWVDSSGGGGGGGGDILVVEFDEIGEEVWSASCTEAEIIAAVEAGKVPIGCRFVHGTYADEWRIYQMDSLVVGDNLMTSNEIRFVCNVFYFEDTDNLSFEQDLFNMTGEDVTHTTNSFSWSG